MAKASDNVFPKLLFSEVVPSTPAAGTQVCYVDPADHKLKRKDSAGTVTTVEAGAAATSSTFSYGGTLAVTTGTARLYNDSGRTQTISTVRASVGTAPAGASVIVDVLKNGTTIFTGGTGRPTIAAGANTATGTPAITSWASGDYLTVSISQVGSSTAGSDLTVTVVAS